MKISGTSEKYEKIHRKFKKNSFLSFEENLNFMIENFYENFFFVEKKLKILSFQRLNFQNFTKNSLLISSAGKITRDKVSLKISYC